MIMDIKYFNFIASVIVCNNLLFNNVCFRWLLFASLLLWGIVLLNELLGCVENMKAIDRFIFLFLLYKDQLCIDGNRKKLSESYGFSEGVIVRTFSYLTKAGLLEKRVKEKNIGERGRPTYDYKNVIIEKVSIKLDRDLNIKEVFGNNKIQSLLDNSSTHDLLNADTKLLLIVLLHNADEFGFVKLLKNAVLLKLTGMKQKALKGQIQKLIDLGYIRSKVSGINSEYLFGRVSSIYILNLQHHNFCRDLERTRKFLYFKSHNYLYGSEKIRMSDKFAFINFSAPGTFEARKLITLANHMLALLGSPFITTPEKKEAQWRKFRNYPDIVQYVEYNKFIQVAILFVTKSNLAEFSDFLQFKLNQYASELCSENIFKLNRKNENVKAKIQNEIFHVNLDKAITDKKEFKGNLFTEVDKSYVVELIYSVSLLIARNISKIFLSGNTYNKIICNQYTYQILPPLRNDFRYLAVDTNCKSSNGNIYFIYGDTCVKKWKLNRVLVAEEILVGFLNKDCPYKKVTYDSKALINAELEEKIELHFLDSREDLSDEQLFCFSLHRKVAVKYDIKDRAGWLSAPPHEFELYQ